MLITLASGKASGALRAALTRAGLAHRALQADRAVLVTDPWIGAVDRAWLQAHDDVAAIDETHETPRLVCDPRGADDRPVVDLGPVPIIAGPCAVESRELAFQSAEFVKSLGLRWMRGGTDKPRTSPHGFQGHGLQAAGWLREAADANGLLCVSEVTDLVEADAYAPLLDMIQVGARNMHNGRLLQRLAKLGRPIILKRGLAATPEEWLWAAEYLLDAGAPTVLFCERGARAASPLKRFTLDLGSVPFIRTMTPFPILVDPSHAAGSSPYVAPLARAAVAAGAHGLIVECHPDPARACSDALQALDFDAMRALVEDIRRWLPLTAEKAGAPC